MKKEVTVGQVLAIAVSVLMSVLAGWISITNKVTRLETEIQQYKTEMYSIQLAQEVKYNKLDNKIDNIQQDITKILVSLERKQDRK